MSEQTERSSSSKDVAGCAVTETPAHTDCYGRTAGTQEEQTRHHGVDQIKQMSSGTGESVSTGW